MADNRTMVELLQAPTEGYEDAIVIPEIAANNFKLKHDLINLVQNKQFFGHDKEDPHAHIPSPAIVEPLRIEFPFLEDQFQEDPPKDPPEVLMADNRTMAEFLQAPTEGYEDARGFFPSSNTSNLHNEITRFQQRFDESFYKAWDRFNDLLRACPHHGFSKLHQLDTFYNALNSKSKVRQSRAKTVVAKMSTSSSTPAISSDVSKLKDMVRALLLDKKNQSSAPAHSLTPSPVKELSQIVLLAVVNQPPAYQAPIPQTQSISKTDFESYVKANDAVLRNIQNQGQNLQIQMANLTDMLSKFMSFNTASSSGLGTLPSNTITNPKEDLKGITTRNGVTYQGPTIPTPSKVVKQGTKVTKNQVQTPSSQSTVPVQPPVIQSKTQTLVSEPVVAPVSVSIPNLKPSIPYPLRRDNERRRDQANEQIEKFYEIFKDMSFEISFMDALILKPKFASTLKALIGNKEKLNEMARTPMNEHSDLGASINLMPLSVWEGLSLLELTPTCMTLELADRTVSKPIGIAKDVSVKVGVFHFPANFVVVDFEPDPRVPLILGRCFLKIGRALIDVHKGKLTLRIENEAITYNLDQTLRYFGNYNQMTANKIDVIDLTCEEYSQEFLGFSDVTASGNPTPHDDLIVSTTSPTLTPFGDSDFLLFEEADAFLSLEDDSNSSKINPFYYDPEGDILLLETILNSEPLPPLPNHEQYLRSFKKELKVCEAKTVKSSVDEPPEVELKDLPHHLEYAFLEGDNKLPVIIAKELGDEEKSTLIKVLNSHKRAIAWKLSDIQGINPEFYTHIILMEEDYKPVVQHQRRVNPKIHDVIKKEVEKLLDAGLIYPIADSPWVSPVHYVPKKGGFTIVENEENELIPTHLVTGWRVCIDYRKLNEATRKDHFPLPFIDQMLERLAGNEYYCFLDGFFGYFQIPIDPRDQEKTTFTCPYGTFAYLRMPFGLCNARARFKDKMLQRCEDTNLCLNWEKSYFMVKEGIVLGHKISKNGIEVDRAKVDVIAKLHHPTTVKVLDTKGAENLAADHLSRLENPYENVLDPKEINETFLLETLSMVTFHGDSSASWFADFANYHAGNFIVKDGVYTVKKLSTFSKLATMDPRGDIMVLISSPKRSLMPVSSSPPFTKMPTSLSKTVTRANDKEKFYNVMRCLKTPSKFVKSLTFGALTSWACSRPHEGTNIFSWQLIICRNGLKRKRSPPMTAELFANSLNLYSPDLVPLELS
uniref:DNA-directed DNA polymerase n=1 Tax=Tanacetum cinerariifolium TaxID=118510 RepID=A0A6L2K1U6_TANCI|nr:DNA-directed DNA polymerase [Tanacetum cinerariifolium]